MVREDEIEYSLEELVLLLRNPPLFRGIEQGELVLERAQIGKFPVIKKGYANSLKRVIFSESKNMPVLFRFFLKRYDSYFGSEIYPLLDSLDDRSINYVVSSLKFEENLRKHRNFLSVNYLDLEH